MDLSYKNLTPLYFQRPQFFTISFPTLKLIVFLSRIPQPPNFHDFSPTIKSIFFDHRIETTAFDRLTFVARDTQGAEKFSVSLSYFETHLFISQSQGFPFSHLKHDNEGSNGANFKHDNGANFHFVQIERTDILLLGEFLFLFFFLIELMERTFQTFFHVP